MEASARSGDVCKDAKRGAKVRMTDRINRDHGFQAKDWHTITDAYGRIQGKVQTPSPMLRDEIAFVRQFLITINRRKDDTMPQQQQKPEDERTNMVWLAGVLKFDPKVFETNVACLIDVGLKSAIQVSIYTGEKSTDGNKSLAAKLKRFKQGDFIKVVAMLRPYGVKQAGSETWKNSMSIDVTAIKNDPPQRNERQSATDDEIPY